MAIKKVTKIVEVRVCDLCEGKISKGYKSKDGKREYDTVLCRMYDEYPTKEDYVKFRKEQLKSREKVEKKVMLSLSSSCKFQLQKK